MLTNVNPLLQPEGVRKLSDVLRGYQKEHWPNMGQHGIILLHLRNNKYDMKRKTSKYFKRPNYFMTDCHTPQESSQSICREHRLVGPYIVRTSTMK